MTKKVKGSGLIVVVMISVILLLLATGFIFIANGTTMFEVFGLRNLVKIGG